MNLTGRDPKKPSVDHVFDTAPATHQGLLGPSSANTYPLGFEENHSLRSDFIRDLTLRQLERDGPAGNMKATAAESTTLIPKTLVRFWHDVHNIPPDVRECLDSWDPLRAEGFVFRMFGDASAAAYIGERYGPRERAAFARCEHPAMRCDFLRLCFIFAEGGLYVDADDVLVGNGWRSIFRDGALKVQPLCYDVPAGGMMSATDLRRTDLPRNGRIFYVNNNPIAAPSGHPVLGRALARATDRLLGDEPAPEIQSTTGPGNLSAVLAAHAYELEFNDAEPDFELLLDWESTAEPCWNLGYRSDARNWRNVYLR